MEEDREMEERDDERWKTESECNDLIVIMSHCHQFEFVKSKSFISQISITLLLPVLSVCLPHHSSLNNVWTTNEND